MRIISTWALTPTQRQVIEQAAGDGARLIDRACKSAEDVSAMVAEGCDILLTLIVPADLSQRAPGLKWMQLYSAGADHMPQGAIALGVIVTTASGIHAGVISEYVFGLMLSWTHRVHISLRAQQKHEWVRTSYFMQTADELRGKTIAIIGYGSIGRETARMAQALGMTVLALKRAPEVRADDGWTLEGCGDPEGRIPKRIYGPEERDAILAESDFVVVTLPLSPHTRGFIGVKQFAAMKPGAYVVNIGRGEVIDEHAMIEALEQKRIAGVGLDVFEREPLPKESPLWDFEEAILTPHMAGGHRGYTDKACELFAENLRRFHSGRPLLNQFDPNLGY
jgi:phosphoglycerate dehydrogenase-like enzyme